ncbi:MAG: response regulator [Bacteroidales bacterium]|nr:response regulator [Bacteroidales bacterium]
MNKTDIFISYTERLIHDGIYSLITTHGGYNIVGSSENNDEIFKLLKQHSFKILIIEFSFPNRCSLKYISKIKTDFPDIKLLLISSLFTQGLIHNFIELGVDAYILKGCTQAGLFTALEKIENNDKYYCPTITHLLLDEFKNNNEKKSEVLTSRESEVLKFLIDGQANTRIAKGLNISLHTVKTHRKNIMDKFGANNLISVLRYACREQLIDQDNGFFCASCPHKIATCN